MGCCKTENELLNEKIRELEARLAQSSVETDVVVVVDRSGSMQSNKSDHEGGLRAFVEKQKSLPRSYLTLVQFDGQNPFELLYDGVPMEQVGNISIEPRGMTPLLDAIGRTINHVNKNTRDKIFLIVSDGQENSSREFSHQTIANLINSKKEAGWQFVFVGTNFDVVTTGTGLGFDLNKNVTYSNTAGSIKTAYDITAKKFAGFRSSRASGQSCSVSADCLNYSEDEVQEIKEA